jgi:hypothetical protein
VAITPTGDSATIGTTEFFIASDSTTATYQTSRVCVQFAINLSAMTAGDSYRVRVYEKINGSSVLTWFDATLVGAQSSPCTTPMFVLCEGWECSVQKISGTDRSIGWSIRTVA